MASVKLSIQSNSENAQIYLRLSVNRGLILKRKTGVFINSKDWSKTTGLPKQNNPTNKNLTTELKDFTNSILKDLNDANSKGEEINGDWLTYRIELYFNRTQEKGKQSDLLLDCLQRIIDTAPTRKNGKGGIGLSRSRINSYNGLKNTLQQYQKKRGVKLKVKDIDLKFVNDFTQFMQRLKYSNGNTQKKISDIKTVCLDAQVNGIETSPQLIKVTGVKTKNDYIVYLTEEEINQIEQTQFKREALENAKKWLLLGTMVGQRGEDLLNLNESNITFRGGLKLIELVQAKGNKNVVIPFSPQMDDLLQNGFPYNISIQKFNKHIKEVCKLAGINTITKAYKYDSETKRKILGKYEKWEVLASHDLRRTFASNTYGKMPTPLIMSITGHSTEKTFLKYIGKTSIDYAQQIAEYYVKQAEKSSKEFKPTVIKNKEYKNASNQ